MGDEQLASLVSKIGQSQYEAGSSDAVPEGVNLAESHAQAGGAGAGVLPDVSQGQRIADQRPADTPPPEQPTPGVDPAHVQQLTAELAHAQTLLRQAAAEREQAMVQQRMAQLQQEEYDFADSIAHLPSWQQDQMLTQRELAKGQQVNLALQNNLMQMQEQVRQVSQRDQTQAEEIAKRSVAALKMGEAGFDILAPENQFIWQSLIQPGVTHHEQMDGILSGFRGLTGAGAERPPAIIAGGARATNAGTSKAKAGSGDLLGLVSGRSYELVGAG